MLLVLCEGIHQWPVDSSYKGPMISKAFPYHSIKCTVNSLRPRHNGRHFPDDIFKRIFLTENVWIPITISLKFVPKGPINNIPSLVQIMAWRRPGDKPLSEPIMDSLPTHICVTRPQWVKIQPILFPVLHNSKVLRESSSFLLINNVQHSYIAICCTYYGGVEGATPYFFSTSCYLIRMT